MLLERIHSPVAPQFDCQQSPIGQDPPLWVILTKHSRSLNPHKIQSAARVTPSLYGMKICGDTDIPPQNLPSTSEVMSEVIPSAHEESIIHDNFAVLLGRMLCSNLKISRKHLQTY